MKRRILWTFLISSVIGWAGAHFTVGNAGAIALRAAVSEGRMRFSSAEQRSAASRIASLQGKSPQEQAAIIAGWWEITSVSELRHLYALLKDVPGAFRYEARAILLGRWAMLEPDSLLLQAAREDNEGKAAILHAFCRHWAAGRSTEEIADMVVSAVGDVRKFVPEMTPGGRYALETALAAGNQIHREFGMDGRVLLELSRRLNLPMPMDGYVAIFSALAATDPAEARRQIALIQDPDTRHAATVGMASRLADSDPAAALALCETGGKDITKAVAPAYLRHLLKLPPAEAWQKAGEFVSKYGEARSNAMSLFLQRMTAKDPAGLVPFLRSQNSASRGMASIVVGMGHNPEASEAIMDYLSEEGLNTVFTHGMLAARKEETSALLDRLSRRDPATQVFAAEAILRMAGANDDFRARATINVLPRLLEMSAGPGSSYSDMRAGFGRPLGEQKANQGVAHAVAAHWPDSATLLDTLSPAARAAALPGFLSGVAAADPQQAAALLAKEPDSPAAATATELLGQTWAEQDLQAALAWADSLPPARRAAARTGMKEQLAQWGDGTGE